MKLPARDKQLHFVGGAVLGLSSIVIGPIYAITLTAFIAAAKEARDSMGYGTAEFADFWWTVAGGLVTAGSIGILEVLIQ